MSANFKSSLDGTKAIIGVGGGDQLELNQSGKLTVTGTISASGLIYSNGRTLKPLSGVGGIVVNDSLTNVTVISADSSASGGANIQTFLTSGTWTKPTGAKVVNIQLWGAGGGGGGGNTQTGRVIGGGSGGGFLNLTVNASYLSTSPVTIGAGGASNSSGGTTIFQNYQSTGGSAGEFTDGQQYGGVPFGEGNGQGTAGLPRTLDFGLSTKGGSGMSSNSSFTSPGKASVVTPLTPGSAGADGGGNGGDGQSIIAGGFGSSGGGGGRNLSGAGGRGGNGGVPAAGGGGGGYGSTIGGAGGQGGSGMAIITTYF